MVIKKAEENAKGSASQANPDHKVMFGSCQQIRSAGGVEHAAA